MIGLLIIVTRLNFLQKKERIDWQSDIIGPQALKLIKTCAAERLRKEMLDLLDGSQEKVKNCMCILPLFSSYYVFFCQVEQAIDKGEEHERLLDALLTEAQLLLLRGEVSMDR